MHASRAGFLLATAVLMIQADTVTAQHAHHHTSAEPAADLALEIDAVRRATERYLDHANAVADGFRRFGTEGALMGEHWFHPDRVRQPLDLEQPSTLQYATIDGKRTLVGVAYTVYRALDDPLPEGFAGPSDEWHVHDMQLMAGTLTTDRPLLRFIVDRRMRRQSAGREPDENLLTMVHAWIWLDNPAGMFAQHHLAIPYLRAGLPVPDAPSFAAASGVSLLADDACSAEVRRIAFVARVTGEQRSALADACRIAADRVKAAHGAIDRESSLDRTAEHAWNEFVAVQTRVLSAEQKRRLESLVEHPQHGAHHR